MPSRPGPPAYLAYRAAASAARRLPFDSLPFVERCCGAVGALAMPSRRAQVDRNITRIYGPSLAPRVRRSIAVSTFTSYARYWLESFRLPGTPADCIEAGVTASGVDFIRAGMEAGNGVVIALPHLGGWEWAAFWLAEVQGWPVTAVAEAIEPPELAAWFIDLRSSLGMEIIPLGPGAGAACARALKENRVVCLVADRDIAGDGIPVEFLGEQTALPAGPAMLALRTGAPLITAATYFDGRRHRFVIDPPIDTARHGRMRDDVRRITEIVAQRLEASIRMAPEQWHLLQPNWPSDLA